jgi:putative endopeptidase
VVDHEAFHEAFGTQPGDAMYKPPQARIRLW